MKKLLVLLILLLGLIVPLACSDNNSNKGTGPTLPGGSGSGGGSASATPTSIIVSTPGTTTPIPTMAINTPTFLHNYVTTAAPNAMVNVGGNITVVEGETKDGGDATAFGSYTVGGGGSLTGGYNGNAVVIGIPTPGLPPPGWAGVTLAITMPLGVAYSSYTGTYDILDTVPGSSAATFYEENPNGWPGVYTNYTSSYESIVLNSPKGLAADQLGNHYVSDTTNGYIDVFGPPCGCGPPVGPPVYHRWNGSSSKFPFVQPYALFCDSNNNLWVTDTGYKPSVVEEFQPIGPLGDGGATFIGSFSGYPNCVAVAVAVDQSASCNGVAGPCVYVADSGNKQVEEYTSTGVLLRYWTIPTSMHEFQNFSPASIALIGNPVSNIIVGDVGNDELQVFGP